jgi:hypothetical protein
MLRGQICPPIFLIRALLILQIYIDRIIQPIRNRLTQLPLNKGVVAANPFTVLNVMTFILNFTRKKECKHNNSSNLKSISSLKSSSNLRDTRFSNKIKEDLSLVCFLSFRVQVLNGALSSLMERT